MRVWTEAVKRAVVRHVGQTGSPLFTRQAFFVAQGHTLAEETGTTGKTPWQTATRDLHLLRRAGLLELVDRGTYRCLGEMPATVQETPSGAIFVLDARADRTVLPEQGFVFASEWSRAAQRTVHQWVIYQGAGGYGAAALVQDVIAGAKRPGLSREQVDPRNYFEFGRVVPLEIDGRIIEQNLIDANGRLDAHLARQPVRLVTAEEFDRILALGLIQDES